MPRPPVLPAIDWKTIYHSGKSYEDWLANGESKENCKKIEGFRNQFELSSQLQAYLRAITQPVYIIAIAEDWCGDVIRHVPVLQKIVDMATNIHIRYISRLDSPQAFVRFLTNGGEAIPKFIFFNHEFVECGNWGPMPEDCRQIIARGKACGDMKTAREKISALYEIDKNCHTVVKELLHLIDIATTKKV